MRSMAIDRRQFVLGSGAALVGASSRPSFAVAARADETYFSARADGAGNNQVVAFDGGGDILLDCALPARCHAIAVRPDGTQCVAVARRPGTFAVVIDLVKRAVAQEIESTPGLTFAGHAVFSADGRRLLMTEDDADLEEGFVSVRDVEDGYRATRSFRTHGVGPHELLWSADGRTIAIANGGILINPDSGRAPLNIESMQPSLALIAGADGSLRRQVQLPAELHRLSIRHLAVLSGRRLAFGMQYQGPLEDDVPLVGIRAPDGAVDLLELPAEFGARVRQYIGSVAADASGRWLAASAPRGNVVLFWDAETSVFAGAIDIADGCGLSRTSRAGEFLLTSGAGVVERVTCGGPLRPQKMDSAPLADGLWDNHVSFRRR
jgi:uncharacterized protein